MSLTSRLSPTDAAATDVSTLDITVLLGGPSEEREVSLESGDAVAGALTRLGHRVVRSDISPTDLDSLDIPADLIFIALHGTFGEDGQLQAILEARGIPYVGSDAAASALAMDKVQSKIRFEEVQVPTPRYLEITEQNIPQAALDWPLPAVVKPVCQGSSVDTTLAKDAASLKQALEDVVARYGRALLEDYIDGCELTVGILGDMALPVCEIHTPREFYDYAAKYVEDTTEYRFDIDLPAETLKEVQRLRLLAHNALGCRDFSRVDWIVSAKDHRPYALEVNTIPGFTSHSLLPKASSRVDIDFDRLCQRIVDLAMSRQT